jgi:CheY-like chemotaxis protein
VQGVRLTVMVVEDEALIRLDVVLELEAAGFDVVDASTADEALEVLVARHDVVALFTDVNMPGELNGIELADHCDLRRGKRRGRSPSARWPLCSQALCLLASCRIACSVKSYCRRLFT